MTRPTFLGKRTSSGDYIGHDPANPDPLRGPEGVKEFISTYRAAFPDARMTVDAVPALAHA